MIFIEAPQGTQEWLQARVGKITASCFADAVSVMQKNSTLRKVGDPTAVAERYAADLAIERISAAPHGEPPKAWVLERGHEMEVKARMLYESRTGAFVTEAGICLSDDGIFGYSTDGLVDDDGLIEIKAPIDSIKILEMWRTGDVSEYVHQMQGGMWITGRKYCDFIMYVPDRIASRRLVHRPLGCFLPIGTHIFCSRRRHRAPGCEITRVRMLVCFRDRRGSPGQVTW